ncbi:MAG: PAS domain-containing protein [Candidatus Acidiferrales bacterium]
MRGSTRRGSFPPDRLNRDQDTAPTTQQTADHIQTEAQLRRSEALLAQAEQLANMGSWEIDVESCETYWSDQFYRILGFEPQQGPVSLEKRLELVHPDDREKVGAHLLAAMQSNQPYEAKTRYLLPGNRVRLFHTRCIPITDSSGRVVRVVGMSQDITDQKEIAEKMRRSEALLAQAEQLANLGSWEYDVEGQTFNWSEQMYRMLARPSEGTPITLEQACAIFHPDDRARVWQDVMGIIADGHAIENELRFVLPDGQVRVFHSRAVPIKNPSGGVCRIRGMSQDITDRKRTEEELRQLSHQLLNIRDDERRKMAQDLHESAAQSLAALKMTLSRVAEMVPAENEHGRQFVTASLELAEDAIREVRTLSHLMHPPMLDFVGLGPALRWYAAGFSERSRIAVKVEIEDDFGRLNQETEIAIFRIVQEALTNVHRHSASNSATIRVARQGGTIHVQVQDQGQGMALPSKSAGWRPPLGIGIAGIRERVKQLDGKFEIRSVPGKGTTVFAVLPFTREKMPG